jgi:ubiquinone biosynthesis protein COQ9
MSPDPERARREILDGVLQRAPFDGWTWRTVEAAAVDAGYEAIMARRCFPRGLTAVVAYFADEADRQMLEGLDSRGLGNLRIRDRIATLVRVRIEQDAPHRDAIRRLIALQATPQYAPGALAQLGRTVDHMWHAAGDTATDFNWYTKRGLLAAVYSSTVLYWLDDTSDDYSASWEFLDRRIENVMQFQKLRGRVDRVIASIDAPIKRRLTRWGARAG